MRDELRVYTISDRHWTGISCSCCNGERAKLKDKKMDAKTLADINKLDAVVGIGESFEEPARAMSIASGYENASRREQDAYDRERAHRDMHKRAVALARDLYDDYGSEVSRTEFDKAGAMYGTDLDHAWDIYVTLADKA